MIVSAAGQSPSLKLIGKSEVAIGFWTGDAFRVMPGFLRPRLMSTDWQPAVTYRARLDMRAFHAEPNANATKSRPGSYIRRASCGSPT